MHDPVEDPMVSACCLIGIMISNTTVVCHDTYMLKLVYATCWYTSTALQQHHHAAIMPAAALLHMGVTMVHGLSVVRSI